MRAMTAVAVLILTAACAAPEGADVVFGGPLAAPRTEAVATVPAATSTASATPASPVPDQTPGPAAPETIPPSPTPPDGPRELGADEDAKIGQPYLYRLFTHCGIHRTWWNGGWWDAEPPLDDGNGNPPPGWGNPYQDGVMTQVSETRLEFTGPDGQRAVFVPAPPGASEPPPCD